MPRRTAQPRPVFVLASATVGAPGICARLLTGLDAEEVTEDGSPRGPLAFALWEPPLTEARGEAGARLRRTATAQAADLLGRLVSENVQTLAFIRSRRGAEAVALAARRSLDAAPLDGAGRGRGGGREPRWRPTGPGTCPRTGAGSRRRCPTGAWSGWPPPPRSSSGSTSPAWTRC